MKSQIKNAQSMHCIIPLGPRRRLERKARYHKVTMSWIVRALIRAYRRRYPNPPQIKRPRNLKGPHVRFSLKVYGDKHEILAWARSNGGEFSPLLREILDLWIAGDLEPDLEDPRTIKMTKEFKLSFSSIASAKSKANFHAFPEDYWPKNPSGNLSIMELGLRNRKSLIVHPLANMIF